jgi:hypothetical protein
MDVPFSSEEIERGVEEMADAPDERDVPGLGLRDCEQAMETDLIDFEEEPDEHLDEAVLDGDSEDETASGYENDNDQDKSAEKDNGEKPSVERFPQIRTETQGKTSSNDGAIHGSAGLKPGKCRKEPPSAPAPRDSTTGGANVGGGAGQMSGRTGLPGSVSHYPGCQAESRQHCCSEWCWRLCTEWRPASGSGHGLSDKWRR